MTGNEASLLKQISATMKTSSAIVPALLASLISMPIGLAGMIALPEQSVIFTIVLLAPLFVVLGQICMFSCIDRDRLHNEEHIERRMQIDRSHVVIGNNATGKETLLSGESVKSINGPETQHGA